DRWGIVVAGDGWHPGVVGIVAARVAERHHRPTLVIALEGGLGRGSGRSAAGVDLYAALASCGDLLERLRGHPPAGGFALRRERVAALGVRFDAAVRAQSGGTRQEPTLEIDAEIRLGAVGAPLLEALHLLEPHGAGNPEPTLLARDVAVESVRVVGDP